MLTYFPTALPDELLYSRLARHHRHCCSTSAKQTLEDLFGDRSVRASIDLQWHLQALSDRMPPGVREQPETLARATLFGLHTAFQPRYIVHAALSAMIDGHAVGLHARLGIAAGLRLPPARLRWCPDCRDEAEARHGEPYWRRSHQIPGVLVCPDHGGPLLDASLPDLRGQHDFIAMSQDTCIRATIVRSPWSRAPESCALLLLIAREASALLDQPPRFVGFDDLALHCRSRLIAAELATPSGRLRLDQLNKAAEVALAPIRNIYPEASSTNWLVAMGRKHRQAFSPLQHILFDLVLGAVPTPLRRHAGPKRRHFLADDRGFELRLRTVAATATGLRAAARALGVDPRTVQRHVARLGLDGPWHLKPTVSVADTEPDREADAKRRWLHALESGGSRTELRRKLPADWTWLRRHHRDWLEANSPVGCRRPAHQPREDWPRLDTELAPLIEAAAAVIRRRLPPARVTISAIERQLGRGGWFGPRLHKLPLCRTGLEKEREELDAFRLRRVAWARETLLAHGERLRPWQVQRLAGLPKSVSPRIIQALREDPAP